MDKNNFFHGIAEELSLGALTAPVERVTGGYLHEMYKLETASGEVCREAAESCDYEKAGCI